MARSGSDGWARALLGRQIRSRSTGGLSVVLTTPVEDHLSLARALRRFEDKRLPDLQLVVAPWGRGNPERMREVLAGHQVLRTARTANAARNSALAAVAGEHLFFMDHLTRLRPGALQVLSEVATENRGYRVVRAVGARGPLALSSYLFSTRYCFESGLRFVHEHGAFAEATCAQALAARPVRLEDQLWATEVPAGAPARLMPCWSEALAPWLRMVSAVQQLVQGAERSSWIQDLVTFDLPGLLADADSFTHDQLGELADTVGALLAALPANHLSRVPVQARVAAWLAGRARWTELREQLALWAVEPGEFRTHREGAKVFADLTGLDAQKLRMPAQMLEVGLSQARLLCSVRRVRWCLDVGGIVLRLDVATGVRHVDLTGAVVTARWTSREGTVHTTVTPRPEAAQGVGDGERHQDQSPGAVTLSTPLDALSAGTWALEVRVEVGDLVRTGELVHRDVHGSAGELRPAPDGSAQPVWSPQGLQLLVGKRGSFERRRVSGLRATHACLEQDELVVEVSGQLSGVPTLRSRREVIPGRFEGHRIRFRLRSDRFGTGEAPAVPGRYRLLVDGTPVRWEPAASDDLGFDVLTGDHRVGVRRTPKGMVLVLLGPPLRDDEIGSFARQQIWQTPTPKRLRDQVLLESSGGRTCSGSPLAIDAELRRTRPGLARCWVVEDHSVTVPEGATAVLRHSRSWQEALTSSRWVVTDSDLDRSFVRSPAQLVLQLADYPATTMGRARWARLNFAPARIQRLAGRGADQWSVLAVPSPRVEEIFRENLGFHGEVLAEGLPSTDRLLGPGVAARRRLTRRRLGIDHGQAAVLYAPYVGEWPTGEGRPGTELDLDQLAEELGERYVVLVHNPGSRRARIPSRTGLVDVSDHPDVADVILASDVAVLDYSALRFDYAVTGKPMVFHVPDQMVRTGEVSGFLWPYAQTTPGPCVSTTAEVVAQLRDLPSLGRRSALGLARFNAQFHDLADAHAAERVVQGFFGARSRHAGLSMAPGLAPDEGTPHLPVAKSS